MPNGRGEKAVWCWMIKRTEEVKAQGNRVSYYLCADDAMNTVYRGIAKRA